MESTGAIESWTTVHRAPAGFTAPYTLATAIFASEAVRVMARLETHGATPRGGMAVRLSDAGSYENLCLELVAEDVE